MKLPNTNKRLKGQFFLLGAILLITLFFAGLPKQPAIIFSETEDIKFLFNNIQKEYPVTFNLGLNESKKLDHMLNFSRFAGRLMDERLVNFTAMWIIIENASTNVNVTAGNFLKHNTTIALNLTSTAGSAAANLTSPYNTTNFTLFNSVQPLFNLTIAFDSETKTIANLQRDKFNLYLFIQLQKQDDIIKGEYSG